MKNSNLIKEAKLTVEIEKLKNEVNAFKALIERNNILETKHTQNQKRFKTIFEESQFGNKILGPDLSILEVNEAFIAMLGYSNKKDIISRKVVEFAHPDFVDHWHELQLKLWEERISSFSIDTCLIRKDASVIWCHVTTILFEDDNRTLGYTILEDISERKLLEETAKRLYEAQQYVMHTVAHDLKSPLNTIQLLSGLIKKNIEDGKTADAMLHLSLLDKTCSRNNVIINDLLLIGELELVSEAIQRKTVDIVEIITSVVEQLSAAAQKKNVTIIQEFPQAVAFAHVDKIKLSRVIENLVSNAIKFTQASGQVVVFVKEEDDHLLLQVIDQGIGIPVSMQPFIFNKFTKAKRKGTEGEQTTGLGLFIAKRIIEMHEGSIWFDSIENKGTKFFVRIPMH